MSYFIKSWKNDHSPPDILEFYSEKDVFAWIQDYKGLKFAAYKSECLLDFS